MHLMQASNEATYADASINALRMQPVQRTHRLHPPRTGTCTAERPVLGRIAPLALENGLIARPMRRTQQIWWPNNVRERRRTNGTHETRT
jgi:hypothetical protein